MKAGVIAAGRGERLQQTNQLKPLVKLGDRTLIEHVLTSLEAAGATEVVIIINENSVSVRDHIAGTQWPFAIRWIVETTSSSMHSFLRVLETLAANGGEEAFLISTTDTVTNPHSYMDYVSAARRLEDADVILALTTPSNDEKPLFVRCATNDSRITAVGEAAAPSDFVTAGLYLARASILREAEAARRDGLDALRKFLGRLLERGYHLAGIPIAKSIDVDHPADIEIAEEFLRTLKT
jgi:NDP-sugar pyrophosphorylase family protein